MTTAFVTHKRFAQHDMPGHPEHAGRLQSVWKQLNDSGLINEMAPLPAKPLSEHTIMLAHHRSLLDRLGQVDAMNDGTQLTLLDADTYMAPDSYTIARMASGGLCAAIDAVLDGEADNALVAARPPGHHATVDTAMGFCLLNHIAIGARHAQDIHALERVLIVDFDVHHGNGTQDIFYADRSVLFISTHQHPLYPGTGMLEETGIAAGAGYTINVPLRAGSGDETLKRVYDKIIWPAARRYQPQLILVSAGFDGHWADPLAGLNLTLEGYAHLTRELIGMAQQLCEGKIIFSMEGGYNLDVIGNGIANVARCLLQKDNIADPLGPPRSSSQPDAAQLVNMVRELHQLD